MSTPFGNKPDAPAAPAKAAPSPLPSPSSSPKSKRVRSSRHRATMNKTGARLLDTFAAALIGWLWAGWGARWTGVQMSDGLLTSLGGCMYRHCRVGPGQRGSTMT